MFFLLNIMIDVSDNFERTKFTERLHLDFISYATELGDVQSLERNISQLGVKTKAQEPQQIIVDNHFNIWHRILNSANSIKKINFPNQSAESVT